MRSISQGDLADPADRPGRRIVAVDPHIGAGIELQEPGMPGTSASSSISLLIEILNIGGARGGGRRACRGAQSSNT